MPKSQWIKANLMLFQGMTIHWPSESTSTTNQPRSRLSGYPLGYKRKKKWKSTPPPIMEAFPTTYKENQKKAIHWDTDGQQLMVDNGASASITAYLTDFITPTQPITARLKVSGDMLKKHTKEPSNGKSRSAKGSHIALHCQTPTLLPRLPPGSYVLNTWHKRLRIIIPYLWKQEK